MWPLPQQGSKILMVVGSGGEIAGVDEVPWADDAARTDGGLEHGTRKGQFWARAGSPPWSSHQRPMEFSTRNLTIQSGVKSWVAAGTSDLA